MRFSRYESPDGYTLYLRRGSGAGMGEVSLYGGTGPLPL